MGYFNFNILNLPSALTRAEGALPIPTSSMAPCRNTYLLWMIPCEPLKALQTQGCSRPRGCYG